MERHLQNAQAAYFDLLRRLKDDQVSDLRGTPVKVDVKGKIYWYDNYRVGSTVRKKYIGEDSDELRARLARQAELKQEEKARQRHKTRLVRQLRADDFLRMDAGTGSMLLALSRSGVFRLGGTLVGTVAFRLYEGELGVRMSYEDLALTDDIDIASFERLSLILEDTAAPPLKDVFRDLAFDPVPTIKGQSVWKWKQTRSETMVEFLTPSFDEEEGIRNLKALGVSAQGLHYLNFLIAEPIHAVVPYRSGVLIQIPRPERFALHKLIVSDRRQAGPEALKARKDRLQAQFLIPILAEDRPDELKDAYDVAMASGPKWQERITRALNRLPDTRDILESL